MKNGFHIWNKKLRSVTQGILNTSSQIFNFIGKPYHKGPIDFKCVLGQMCLFLKVFRKMTFYHYTLCTDIFLGNG